MIWRAVIAAGAVSLALSSIPGRTEGDAGINYEGMRSMHAAPGTHAPAARHRRAYAPVVDIVGQQARAFGVPEKIAYYHALRESGFNPAAKNPRSTAKGTLQIIKGSHAAIVGRNLSLAEHLALAGDPYHGTRVGMAHIAAAYRARPHWSADQLWRRCHVAGLNNCGTSLEEAAAIYRGSAPMLASRFTPQPNPYLEVRG